MINITPYIYLIAVIVVIFILYLLFIVLRNKIRKSIKSNKKEARVYGRDLVIGLVSGVMVLVIDRVVNFITNNSNLPHLDTSSLFPFIASLIGIIFIVVIISLALLDITLFLAFLGFPRLKKSK